MNTTFVNQLEALGYFNGLSPEKARSLKQDFQQKGWDGIFSDSHRLFMSDAENLAEGGIGEFIREIEPFLAAQGVHLPEIEDEVSEKGYVVQVDGVAHKIYDEAEFKRDCSGEQPGLMWGLSSVRGFGIVNELLDAAGSQERVYAVNGGNDLFAFFLSPALFKLITEHPNASPKDGPYQLTEEYPWHGAPH
jgi:hypothetical protein